MFSILLNAAASENQTSKTDRQQNVQFKDVEKTKYISSYCGHQMS